MAQNEPSHGRSAAMPGAPARRSCVPATSPEIPDKLYFRIGDVARICDLPAYVLRFWETEFPQLKPNKGGTGQRLYRRRDVELALRIKRLLYDEGYTIPGARQLLKSDGKPGSTPQLSLLGPEPPETRKLQGVRRELQAIAAMLARPAGVTPRSTRTERRAATLQPMMKPSGSADGTARNEILFEQTRLLD
jgi:DNA-binding transcriptional MerR regulator